MAADVDIVNLMPLGLEVHMLERYLRAVVRYRIIVMLLVALSTLLLASQTRQLSIVVDPDDILPQSHPLISTTNRIEALFGNRFTVVIGVHATSGTIYELSLIHI